MSHTEQHLTYDHIRVLLDGLAALRKVRSPWVVYDADPSDPKTNRESYERLLGEVSVALNAAMIANSATINVKEA